MIFRKAKGARTDKLECVLDNCHETPVVGTEYYSPKQHGGTYGTIYRQYFTTSLPADLTSGDNVSRLIDYALFVHDSTDRYALRGWSDNGSASGQIKLLGTSGNNNLLLGLGGVFSGNIIDGWVEYTK